MARLEVNLGERRCPIHIGSALLAQLPALLGEALHRDVLLISNTTVAPFYVDPVRRALGDRRVVEILLPDGEQYKTLETAARVFDVMVSNRLARDCSVLALGGGVVGDLAGFAAACYLRGVDVVQLPTTLLAQVDSSVGGKTAVNHPGGKNLIGAFHQPRAVVIDTEVLRTLPARELSAGLAEIIKYGLAFDRDFLAWLDGSIEALRSRDAAALIRAIERSCQIKAAVVMRDEREHGERALLNLGHTFGHAIEAATGYTEWLHGEAVGSGLLMAADMSHRMGFIGAAEVALVRSLLQRAGLGAAAPQIGVPQALLYMGADKKVKAGRIRLILLEQLGKAFVTGEYPEEALSATLGAHFGAV